MDERADQPRTRAGGARESARAKRRVAQHGGGVACLDGAGAFRAAPRRPAREPGLGFAAKMSPSPVALGDRVKSRKRGPPPRRHRPGGWSGWRSEAHPWANGSPAPSASWRSGRGAPRARRAALQKAARPAGSRLRAHHAGGAFEEIRPVAASMPRSVVRPSVRADVSAAGGQQPREHLGQGPFTIRVVTTRLRERRAMRRARRHSRDRRRQHHQSAPAPLNRRHHRVHEPSRAARLARVGAARGATTGERARVRAATPASRPAGPRRPRRSRYRRQRAPADASASSQALVPPGSDADAHVLGMRSPPAGARARPRAAAPGACRTEGQQEVRVGPAERARQLAREVRHASAFTARGLGVLAVVERPSAAHPQPVHVEGWRARRDSGGSGSRRRADAQPAAVDLREGEHRRAGAREQLKLSGKSRPPHVTRSSSSTAARSSSAATRRRRRRPRRSTRPGRVLGLQRNTRSCAA